MRQVKADEIFRVCIWLYIKYLVEEGINNGLAALFLEKRPYIRELQVHDQNTQNSNHNGTAVVFPL